MAIVDVLRSLMRLIRLGAHIVRLPVAKLHFDAQIDHANIRATHAAFTKRHPRYYLIRNKSLGIALIDLRAFATRVAYVESVREKDFAGHHCKRAKSRGYVLRELDRNDFLDDIYAINISMSERQGRPMDQAYLKKPAPATTLAHHRFYGVISEHGRLVAYCRLGVYGNFAATDQLLGYRNNDGTMYFLLAEIICLLIDEGRMDYFMYDSYLGARPGLQDFKRRLGFKPYRVRYSIN